MPRIGGYIITQDKMLAWGARLLGKRTEDLDWATAFCACLRRVMQFRGDLVPITYPSNVDAYMIPLKIAAYPGRTDMNISTLPPFNADGRNTEKARKLLIDEGMPQSFSVSV